MLNIKIDDVASVYSGKVNHCCCGCAGKHTVASKWRAYVGRDRGYEVRDEEVSDRTVKLILNKIAKVGPDQVNDDFVSAETDSRLYIAYLVKKGAAR